MEDFCESFCLAKGLRSNQTGDRVETLRPEFGLLAGKLIQLATLRVAKIRVGRPICIMAKILKAR